MKEHPQLFISYSQRDGDAAAALLDILERAGVTCFLAEKSIAPGAEWDNAIREAITHADRILVLITPQSRESVWVAAEVGAAWILGKAVIPALQSVDPRELVGPISKYHGRRIETAEQIKELVKDIGGSRSSKPAASPKAICTTESVPAACAYEDFTLPDTWERLFKIGRWLYESKPASITGDGMYRYLLSNRTYGTTGFTIQCRLTFLSLRPENSLDAVNAGIVLGWSVPNVARRYYQLAFSGKDVFLELIGSNEGDEYIDFRHLSPSIRFKLIPNVPYDFEIRVTNKEVTLSHSGQLLLSCLLPNGPIIGRVGLRPWRSTLKCEKFFVVASAG